MKKEKLDYFEEYVNSTNYIVESVKILENTLENYNDEVLKQAIEEVHKLENEADKEFHKMRKYLISDFLPPIDREDIALLCYKLDNVEDYIDEILINFKILNITEIKKEGMKEYTELLSDASNQLKQIFNNLKNLKNASIISEEIIKINYIEEAADRQYEKSMERLYTEEKDAIEIIKWTTIYTGFENIFDACEEVGNCIENIIVKNS